MKKILQFVFICLFAWAFAQVENVLALTSLPQLDNGTVEFADPYPNVERIIDFHSEVDISLKSVATITETIKVYAAGNEIKRGIFRALPTIRNTNKGIIDVDYTIVSIKKNDVTEPYKKEVYDGVLNLYIGDKDEYLSSGIYTYEIKYKTSDQITKFSGYDEFYWNVNGTDWSFPVDHISTRITLPIGADILQNSCYTGVYGSKDQNCTSQSLTANQIFFEASNLNARENLTVAVGFKPNVLQEPSMFWKSLKRD